MSSHRRSSRSSPVTLYTHKLSFSIGAELFFASDGLIDASLYYGLDHLACWSIHRIFPVFYESRLTHESAAFA